MISAPTEIVVPSLDKRSDEVARYAVSAESGVTREQAWGEAYGYLLVVWYRRQLGHRTTRLHRPRTRCRPLPSQINNYEQVIPDNYELR